ncbi:MAG: ABC transporter substrate-binding protein, partial [Anaerolineaceae bacterium]|nr:ABC transporter substrate-binding protein [Anaerolineaceae bacterium]
MKRLTMLSTALCMVLALLVACGPAETPEPTQAPETAPTAAPAGETAAPAAKERLLRITFSWPLYADPAVGSDYASSTALANVYETLIFPNAEAGVDPWLAESWDISDDGLTYTFHLREGVKFHDGSELVASDVVYSYNRLKTIGEGYAYLVSGVADIQAPDDYTVVFQLEEPSGLFVPSLVRLYILNEDQVRANTLAEGAYGEEGDFGKEWLLTHDAGSGPYTIIEFPLEEYCMLEKFEDWWAADKFHANAADRAKLIGTTEAATVRSMLSTGELEISDQWQTVEAYQALDAIDGVHIQSFVSMSSFYYMVHTRKPPTDDIHCRKAMAYAFDYEGAVALEWPGTPVMDGPVPAILGGHDPNVMTYTHDLDKAREELAQCQYADNLDDYPIEVHWISEVPHEEKFALLFQANMAELGMKVEVVQMPWLSVVQETAAEDTSPHIVTVYVSAALPEAGLMIKDRYHSSTAPTW